MKEYPKRDYVEPYNSNLDFCECGHEAFRHETLGLSSLLPKNWSWYHSTDGKCKDCMCPKFNEER